MHLTRPVGVSGSKKRLAGYKQADREDCLDIRKAGVVDVLEVPGWPPEGGGTVSSRHKPYRMVGHPEKTV